MTEIPFTNLSDRKLRVALLTNQISPYRRGMFKRLAERVELTVIHGNMEHNRHWGESKIGGVQDRTVAGWAFPFTRREIEGAGDQGFLHVEPGYITELFRTRPDVIISGELGFRTMVALFYGAIFRTPVWVWWGGTTRTEQNASPLRRMARWLAARWVKHWISYGQTSTEYLRTLQVPAERILQIQNCVDETEFQKHAPALLPLGPKPVVLYAGRLVARKGIEVFLGAVARCQSSGIEFSTLLVGSGPDEAALKRLAAELHLRHIHFVAAQPAEAMPGYYQSADLLVFPTLADVWGLVANEAILSGIPVLCSKYAGCAPELFDPESIFDPTDPEDFASKLSRAVRGECHPVPKSRLWSSGRVADCIAEAVAKSIRPRPSKANPGRRAHLVSRVRGVSLIGLTALLMTQCSNKSSPAPNVSVDLPAYLMNAPTPLVTPTFDGSGQAMHPGVVVFDKPWHGYTYWMAVTPYPNWDASKEEPSLLASTDGQNWVVPGGLVEPLENAASNLADTDLIYDPASDQLWVYYIHKAYSDGTHMIRRVSSDGVTWSTAQDMFSFAPNGCLSPAVDTVGGLYYMWCVNAGPAGSATTSSAVEVRTSIDGQSWSSPKPASINQPGYVIWHIDVISVPSKQQEWMAAAAYPVGTSSGHTALFFATSNDALNWQTFSNPALKPGTGWDATLIYRSKLLYDSTQDRLRLWYSAANGQTWHTGYAEANYTSFLKHLQ